MADFNKLFSNETGFARFMNNLADILIIGILWMITCIPVITIGAANTAAYYTMVKVVRRSTGKLFAEYFKSFKNNFLQSLPMTIGFEIISVLIGINILYLWNNENKINDSLFVITIFLTVLFSSVYIYAFPLLSRFEWKNIVILKTSLILSFRYIYVNLGMIALFLLCLVLVFLMPWAIIFLPGIYFFVFTLPVEWILKKLMPPVEEGSEEADKWYYG